MICVNKCVISTVVRVFLPIRASDSVYPALCTIFFFFTFIGNIMMIHLSLTGPKTPLKQTSEMWGKQLHRA